MSMPSEAEPPIVSVIVPVRNGARDGQARLKSLSAQTFANWEALAVNDGCSDAFGDILQDCAGQMRGSGCSARRRMAD